ncbi:MAG TPA: ABC transporter ATP-binding protein [Acidimicrobiia bacterium]
MACEHDVDAAAAPALELHGVHTAYGPIEVLHGVDLTIAPGAVVGLLGPNGAGKSTTIRVATGLMKPTEGCVHIFGRHQNGTKPDAIARAGVRAIPEARGVFPNLTVRDNLRLATYAAARGADVEERAYTEFPWLRERRKQLAGTLSGGEQRMLAMARVITGDPKVLLLDELSMGLAPVVLEQLYEHVAHMSERGVALVIVEQFARAVLDIADHVAVLAQGTVVAAGKPADVVDSLPDAYLGAGA